ITGWQIDPGPARSAAQQVDFHQMDRSGQEGAAPEQVLLVVGLLAGWAKQVHDCDRLAVGTVMDFQTRETLGIHTRLIHACNDPDEVAWPHLRTEQVSGKRNEGLVEVVPDSFLFQIRVHAGKRRRHGTASLCTRTTPSVIGSSWPACAGWFGSSRSGP